MEIIARGEYSVKRLPVNGKDAYSFVLSKESATVSYNADGNAISGELGLTGKARTEVCVLRGNTPLTLADPNRTPTNLLRNSKAWTNLIGIINNGGGVSIDSTLLYEGKSTLKTQGAGITLGVISVKENTYYTYTTMIYAESDMAIGLSTPLHLQCISSLNTGLHNEQEVTVSTNKVSAKTWTKVSNTFLVPKGGISVTPFLYSLPYITYLGYAQLTEGKDIPDEWEPHPSDPVARKGEFKILSATVISGTASVSILNNVIYTNSLTSDTAVIRISINAEGVDMYRDFTLQKLSIKQQVEASMQVLKESINLEIRKIEIGGRNLIPNSSNICNISQIQLLGTFTHNVADKDGGNNATQITFDRANGFFRIGQADANSILKISGNTYTYSIWIYPLVGSQVKMGISALDPILVNLTAGKWQRIYITGTMEDGAWYDAWRLVDIYSINSGDSFKLYHPQVEIGNKLSDWSPNPDDIPTKDNILSSINLSKEGVKIDGKKVEITGELLAQIIKAKGLNVGDKTFIDALGNFRTDNGTFTGKMNATSGSIGNFSIVNGDIIGVDTAKKERIRISTNPLPTLADLFTGYNIISPELNLEFEDYFEIDSQGSERTQVVCSFRRTIHLEARTTIMLVGQGATYSHRLQGGGTDCFRGATRNEDINFYNSSNQLVATGGWNRPIDIPAGDIIIEITSRFVALSVDAWVDPSIYRLTISTGWQGILAQGTTERTYIGSDGFYSVFGSGEYVYFKRGVGFVTKGKTDTGGVLASGSVAANGTQTNVWGAKSSNAGATKVSVGVFDVPHRVGHANYTITATSHHGGISMSIVSKSAYSVQLAAVANGDQYSVGFDYTIIGQN